MSCATMCRSTLYFTRSTNIHEDDNVFWRAVLSATLVVCLYRDLTKCLRPCACVRPECVQPKGRTCEENSRRLYMWPYYISWAMSRQLGEQRNEKVSNRKCRVYIDNQVTWPAPKRKIYFPRDKIKCTDVVADTRQVISLTNRFSKL